MEAGTFYDNWDEYSITDKSGTICEHSINIPYKYQANFYNSEE